MSKHPGFTISGSDVYVTREFGTQVSTIPAGVYSVLCAEGVGYYLERHVALGTPDRVYGIALERANKVMNSFLQRNHNTGVLLSGQKGSGKTMLTRVIADKAVALGMPVLLINTPYYDAAFLAFMSKIEQDCVVLIDEFDKKYDDNKKQECLLSLLDGIGNGRKLYLLTANHGHISQYITGRTGRVLYHWVFGKLDKEVFDGYLAEHPMLTDTQLHNMKTFYTICSDYSFDIMQTLVEECERYPETPFWKHIADLNIPASMWSSTDMELVEVSWGDRLLEHSGNTVDFDMRYMRKGATSFTAEVQDLTWEDAVEIYTYLQSIRGVYGSSAHHQLLEFINNGTLPENGVPNSVDVRFRLRFGKNDYLDGSRMQITHMISGKPFVFNLAVPNDIASEFAGLQAAFPEQPKVQ